MAWKVSQTNKRLIRTERRRVLSRFIWFDETWHQMLFSSVVAFFWTMEAKLFEKSSKHRFWELALQKDMGCLCDVLMATFPVEREAILTPDAHSLLQAFQQMLISFCFNWCVIWCRVKISKRETQTWPSPMILLDSSASKIWRTVRNFLHRETKCNHSVCCSGAGFSVVPTLLYTFGMCVVRKPHKMTMLYYSKRRQACP